MDYHTFMVDLIEGFFKLFRIPNKDSKPTHLVSRTSKPLTASRLRSLSPVYGSQVKKKNLSKYINYRLCHMTPCQIWTISAQFRANGSCGF